MCPYCSFQLVNTQEKVPNLTGVQENTSNSLLQAKTKKVIISKGETKASRNQVGQGIVIYSAIQAIIVTLLFYVAPELFSLWYIRLYSISDDITLVIGGFATMGVDDGTGLSLFPIDGDPTFMIVLLIMGIGIIGGFIGGLTKSKRGTISGGLILLLSMLIVIVVIGGGIGVFGELADIVGILGQNLLYGSYNDFSGTANWGLGAGAIIPLISSFMMMGGGMLLENESKDIENI